MEPTITATVTVTNQVAQTQPAFSLFGLDSNWVLVIITLIYTLATFLLVLETWLSRRRTEQRYERERKEMLKTYVVPVQWSSVWHRDAGKDAGLGWGSLHLDIQNLGPGPAKDIRVFVYSQHINYPGYYTGFVPGLVAGGSVILTLEAVKDRSVIPAGGIDDWGISLKEQELRAVAVHIAAQTALGEEMPVVTTTAYWRASSD